MTKSTCGSCRRPPCPPGLPAGGSTAAAPLNLGSGQGQSVLKVVQAMEAASGRFITCEFTDRRPGDAAISVADPSQAVERLGLRTQRGLKDICRDGWT